MQRQTTSQQEPTAIRRVGQGRYIIPSRTRAGREHHIDLIAGTCSCEAAEHGHKCWAYNLSKDYSQAMGAWLKQQRAGAVEAGPKVARPRNVRSFEAARARLLEAFG